MHVTKTYEIEMEIEGDMACFLSPEEGSEGGSYPIPPYSAVKGIFESILFLRHAEVIPYKIHVCRPIQYTDASFNNHVGHLRKRKLIKEGNTQRIGRFVLFNVVYQFFATVRNHDNNYSKESKRHKYINHAHSYQDQFNRRIKIGASGRNVHLGTSEYLPLYAGPIRKDENGNPINNPLKEVSLYIPNILHHPFDKNMFANQYDVKPRFTYNGIRIDKGVALYADISK